MAQSRALRGGRLDALGAGSYFCADPKHLAALRDLHRPTEPDAGPNRSFPVPDEPEIPDKESES